MGRRGYHSTPAVVVNREGIPVTKQAKPSVARMSPSDPLRNLTNHRATRTLHHISRRILAGIHRASVMIWVWIQSRTQSASDTIRLQRVHTHAFFVAFDRSIGLISTILGRLCGSSQKHGARNSWKSSVLDSCRLFPDRSAAK